MAGYSVVGSDEHGAVVSELIGLQAVADLRAVWRVESVLEVPGNFVSADEERALDDLEANGGLEEVEGACATLFEAVLHRRSDRV